MAGGRGNDRKSVNYDRTSQWLCHHRLCASVTPKVPISKKFKERQGVERERAITKNINDLQENVLRLIYSNVDLSREERSLVEAILDINCKLHLVDASPTNDISGINERIYKDYPLSSLTLIKHPDEVERYATVDVSSTSSDMADSGLETGSVSPHENTTSENSSTDFEESQVAEYASASDDLDKIRIKRTNENEKTAIEVEHCDGSSNYVGGCPTKDLADSALMECTSNDHSATCSSFEAEQHQLDSSSSSTENHQKKLRAEDIYRYENQVLSDPFYESDCGSDENESFEFVDPINIPSITEVETVSKSISDPMSDQRRGENLDGSSNSKRSIDPSCKVNLTNPNSSTGSTNYYFIDASTLNDEVEVLTTDIRQSHCYSGKTSLPAFNVNYEPSSLESGQRGGRKSEEILESAIEIDRPPCDILTTNSDDQSYKCTAIKAPNPQTGHERVAEFERELKLTEYLEPLTEPRKVKRVDSVSDEKADRDKGTEKESLVVEIKEADSGESTQHSPCPDNNSNRIANDKNVNDKGGAVLTNEEIALDSKSNGKDGSADSQGTDTLEEEKRPPLLIRRNTFELDSNDEKLSVLRQEYERRQGNLVFQSAIPQYSGHRVDGDSSCYQPASETTDAQTVVTEALHKPFPTDMGKIPISKQYHATASYLSHSENHKYDIDRNPMDSFTSQAVIKKASSLIYPINKEGDRLPEESLSYQLASECNLLPGRVKKIGSAASIYPVTKSASDKLLMTRYIGSDDMTSNDSSNSLPATLTSTSTLTSTLSCIGESEGRADSVKRSKRGDETTPIVSGGVSTSDYSSPKVTDSPLVRRKTESTPIVSGGSVIMNEPEVRAKPPRIMSSSMTAWVVDMSDCSKNDVSPTPAGPRSAGMSHSFSTTECARKSMRKQSNHESNRESNRESNHESNHESNQKSGSTGFFVDLNDTDAKNPLRRSVTNAIDQRKGQEQSENSKPYCEFYVDVSAGGEDKQDNGTRTRRKIEREESSKVQRQVEGSAAVDKKNIFSMFIDISEPRSEGETKICHRRVLSSSSSSSEKRADNRSEERCDTPGNGKDHHQTPDNNRCHEEKLGKERNKPVFMFIESDSPVVRRRTLSTSRAAAFKRHSWNVDKTVDKTMDKTMDKTVNSTTGNDTASNASGTSTGTSANGHVAKELMFRKEHKRAHSLSVDRGDLKRLQAKASSSSHSLSDAARAETLNKSSKGFLGQESTPTTNMDTSFEDVFEFDVRDTPPNSHVEIINEELRVSVKKHEYRELVMPNEGTADGKTYDEEYSEISAWEKTCTDSTTEGQTRKSETFDISSGSDPSPGSDNHDFELSDILNGEAPQSMSDRPAVPPVANKISATRKSLNETIKKIECELQSPGYPKTEAFGHPSTSHEAVHERSTLRDTKVQPEGKGTNFVRLSDLDNTPGSRRVQDILTVKEDRSMYRLSNSIPETSWIESKLVMARTNAPVRTIPRKFTPVMSTSLPSKQKSPLEDLTADCEGEGIISESDLSSMQSSMGRSGAEGSTEETETSSLAGGGKPYNRLGEDLLRMFLEEINPDVTIDVAGRRIRAHKCILSSRCQYFAAILSGGWIESAGNVISLQGYSYNAVHFALCHIYSGESNIPDSISIVELATLADMLCLEGLKEVIGYTLKVKYCHLFHKPCQICAVGVLECMPLAAAYGLDEVYRKSLRWIMRHFVRIWPCKAFATLPRELMEKCYHQHIVHMSTDNVLQTMMDCDKLLATLPNVRWAEPVFRMVSNLLETSVKFLSDNFSGVLGNDNFQSLGRELTWNISRLEDNFLAAAERLPAEQACKSYSKLHKMLVAAQVDDPQMKMKWGPLFVDFLKKIQGRVEKCLVRDAARAARTTTWLKMDLDLRRRIQELACLVILPHETSKRQSRHSNFLKEPRAPSTRSASRSLDLRRVKMAISEHNDKTLKQATVTQQAKKVLHKPKSDPMERKVQEDKQVASETTVRPKSWPNKIEVKSRYLEPRNKSIPKEGIPQVQPEKVIVQQRRKIMISSSDSSRTSSPAMKRATDNKKSLAKIKLPIKKDVKALSSDSLAESNLNRSNRKDLISKSCGITRPESPSFKQRGAEIGLSVDSLAESKVKPAPAPKKKATKMDTSMSTDSLMTEITTTPKSSSNKSPTLNKGITKMQHERVKKSSPPMQQRNLQNATRRTPRSLESSTAASRSRAAAISAYHGSPSLRRSLLDAAKTPDIPIKSINSVPLRNTQVTRQVTHSPNVQSNQKKERRGDSNSNSHSAENASKKSSPKLGGAGRMNKSAVGKRMAISATVTLTTSTTSTTSTSSAMTTTVSTTTTATATATTTTATATATAAAMATTATAVTISTTMTSKATLDDKVKTKCHNGETPKQPTVGSRSGTFLKDEPTILKKADIKSSQINT